VSRGKGGAGGSIPRKQTRGSIFLERDSGGTDPAAVPAGLHPPGGSGRSGDAAWREDQRPSFTGEDDFWPELLEEEQDGQARILEHQEEVERLRGLRQEQEARRWNG